MYADVFMLPVYMRLKPFLTQVGGVGALICSRGLLRILLISMEETDL